MNRKEHIQHLYRVILGRDADESGLNNYLNSNLDLYQIQLLLWQSDEFKNKFSNLNLIEPTPLDNKLPIFIVNLERRTDRKRLIESRLANLGIKNYEIIKAVDGKELPEDISDFYNKQASIKLHRQLTLTEIACALSHIQIAKKIIEQELEYAIILEDDAELTLDFKNFLANFNLKPNLFEFLILGSFSSNQFFNNKTKTIISPYALTEKESITYLDKVELNIGNISAHKAYYPSQKLDYVHGTHAYVISYAGAKKLIELNFPVVVEADNIWNYYIDKCNILFTNPILVHRQHEDSDIRDERNQFVDNFENYSDNFKSRKYHQDFGT